MTKIVKTLSLVVVLVAVGFLGSCANDDATKIDDTKGEGTADSNEAEGAWIDGIWSGNVQTAGGGYTIEITFKEGKYKTGSVEGTYKYKKKQEINKEKNGTKMKQEIGTMTVDGVDCTSVYTKGKTTPTATEEVEALALSCPSTKTKGLRYFSGKKGSLLPKY